MNKKYHKLLDEGWEVGSSNTFADLALADAERLQAKAYLRAVILSRLNELAITQLDASRRMGIPQPKISKLISDPTPSGFTSDKLIDLATKLGLDVEIRVKNSRSDRGKVIVLGPERRRGIAAPKARKRAAPRRGP